jgi:integrase
MTRKRRGRGEGGIRFREDKQLWVAEARRKDGYRQTVYGKTKGEVQEKLRAVQVNGPQRDADKLTLCVFIRDWLERVVKPSVQPATHDRYEIVMRLHVLPHLGESLLSSIKPGTIKRWYAALESNGVSPRNRSMAGTVLGTALRYAVEVEELIDSNPAGLVRKPRVPKSELTVWNREQIAAFLKAARSNRLYAFYLLAAVTGMREGELFALKWLDVDWVAGAILVQRSLEEVQGRQRLKEPKTAAGRRRIDLPAVAMATLAEHRQQMVNEAHGSDLVFCNRAGAFLRRGNFRLAEFLPLVKRAGVPVIRVHDLRHTAATLLLLAGENPKIVQERLGHSRIQVTLDTYSHVLPTMQRSAVAKLDKLFSENGGTMAVQEGESEDNNKTQSLGA